MCAAAGCVLQLHWIKLQRCWILWSANGAVSIACTTAHLKWQHSQLLVASLALRSTENTDDAARRADFWELDSCHASMEAFASVHHWCVSFFILPVSFSLYFFFFKSTQFSMAFEILNATGTGVVILLLLCVFLFEFDQVFILDAETLEIEIDFGFGHALSSM